MSGFISRGASGDQIAQLIGAGPGEVIAADTTSINLFKMLGAALCLRPGRGIIVSEQENFPADLYIAQGLSSFLGGEHGLRLVPRSELNDALGDDVAVVALTHVDFKNRRGSRHGRGHSART